MDESKNYAKERISDDMSPVFPGNDIVCKDCMFRKSGIIGYKNAYCEIYPRGKPNEILFKSAGCQWHVGESTA